MVEQSSGKRTEIETRIEARNSSIELLRIFAMLLIIFQHYAVHGGFDFGNEFSFNHIFIDILNFGGKIGSNIFVIISGYFLIMKDFSIKRLAKLLFEVVFYSLGIYLLLCAFGIIPLTVKALLFYCIPVTEKTWWFVTAYVILYCLGPFINAMLRALSRKQFKILLIFITLIWSVTPTLLSQIISKTLYEVSILGWFIFLYCIASYFRLYRPHFAENKGLLYGLLIISVIVMVGSTIYNDYYVTLSNPSVLKKLARFAALTFDGTKMNDLMPFVASIAIFLLFRGMNLKHSKAINLISATTFGIYLLHDSSYRGLIWLGIFKNSSYANSPWLFAHAIISVTAVFAACMIVDMLRILLIENTITRSKSIKKTIGFLEKKYDNVWW